MLDKFSKLIGVESKASEGMAASQGVDLDLCYTFAACLLEGVTKARLDPTSPLGVRCCK
ncbi:hypothetical protein J27TS7_02440 [Paenibacillus dendritiformis]|nr:hypothetical protein J27TS7_02440 [Paenibacillus dendritiformis]